MRLAHSPCGLLRWPLTDKTSQFRPLQNFVFILYKKKNSSHSWFQSHWQLSELMEKKKELTLLVHGGKFGRATWQTWSCHHATYHEQLCCIQSKGNNMKNILNLILKTLPRFFQLLTWTIREKTSTWLQRAPNEWCRRIFPNLLMSKVEKKVERSTECLLTENTDRSLSK